MTWELSDRDRPLVLDGSSPIKALGVKNEQDAATFAVPYEGYQSLRKSMQSASSTESRGARIHSLITEQEQ